MMIVYPGDLRVFRFATRAEVFAPTTEEQIVRFYRVLDRDLPRRFVPNIEALDEAFPRIAAALRRIGCSEPEVRLGPVLGDYYDEPDALVRAICNLAGSYDLRLTFREPAELERFRQAYEMLFTACEVA